MAYPHIGNEEAGALLDRMGEGLISAIKEQFGAPCDLVRYTDMHGVFYKYVIWQCRERNGSLRCHEGGEVQVVFDEDRNLVVEMYDALALREDGTHGLHVTWCAEQSRWVP